MALKIVRIVCSQDDDTLLPNANIQSLSGAETRVGSIRLFFPGLSPFSFASLLLFAFVAASSIMAGRSSSVVGRMSWPSALKPLRLLLALCVRPAEDKGGIGVSGGVIQVGTLEGTGPECAAATEGTFCKDGVGCIKIAPVDDWL